eukprot:CAMPEP_0114452950 /NCGR_PEP_ID=MMETSP0104-20121206/1783_1 /TAXON_ID=37642 ORGANISM="Paraphysomonas imperforata, Strain PA2" /NCGR_SAMPLE_ID=MMETSP0104 /ASSEMBLY_ACC=CAM_ASM_000202 /LENGTH=362 /DNA_ID=CAMNT_0001625225 /DNA_START=27 /DNA_END=1112 /DNA_ORIENTATION=-
MTCDLPALRFCIRQPFMVYIGNANEQVDFIYVTEQPVRYEITSIETQQRNFEHDFEFGNAFLGRSWRQVNAETDQWQRVDQHRPDIVIHVINFREYFAFKEHFDDREGDIANMIEIMRRLQHPNIANLVDCLRDEDNFYIITEFGGEDLYNVLSNPNRTCLHNQGDRRAVFIQIVLALAYLQYHGIYHQNLSMENIVFDVTTGAVKVTGFGMATLIPRMTLDQIEEQMNIRGLGEQNPYPLMFPDAIGTELLIPLFILPHESRGALITISPEIFAGRPIDGYGADAWALGVILFFLMEERLPWTQALPSDFDFVLNSDRVELTQVLANAPLSQNGKELLCDMLSAVNPANRLVANAILEHAW